MFHALYLSCYEVLLRLFPFLGTQRSLADQAIAAAQSQTMILYGKTSDTNSASVIKEIYKLRLPIPIQDPFKNNTLLEDLKESGGKLEIPCLKIKRPDKRAKYLYNKDDIISFLRVAFN